MMTVHNEDGRILPPEAFGLNPQQIYDYRALPYWQQFSTDEFIRAFYHDIVNKQGVTLGFMAILRDDPQLADLKLSETYSIRDAFDAILRGTDETIRFLELAKTLLLQAVHNPPSANSSAPTNGAPYPLDQDDEIIT